MSPTSRHCDIQNIKSIKLANIQGRTDRLKSCGRQLIFWKVLQGKTGLFAQLAVASLLLYDLLPSPVGNLGLDIESQGRGCLGQ